MTTLHDRLDRLTTDAPDGGRAPAEVWSRGLRRARRRRAGTALAAAVVVAGIVASSTLIGGGPAPIGPADVPADQLRLPSAVNPPGPWSDDDRPGGPLAAVGVAERWHTEGLFDSEGGIDTFGVSAVDGVSRWLALPDDGDRQTASMPAVSPDGRWVAGARRVVDDLSGEDRLLGWWVLDTTTNAVRDLVDPRAPDLGESPDELTFSGDSRYLLTSYSLDGSGDQHHLVAWDLDAPASDPPPVVVEPPSRSFPVLGSDGRGIVWAHGRTVFRTDSPTAPPTTLRLAERAVGVSWSPGGGGFAYLGRSDDPDRPRRLYAGTSPDDVRHVPLDAAPEAIVGWRDDRHVVVDDHSPSVRVVDIVTGEVEVVRLDGAGTALDRAVASGLWPNESQEPPTREGLSDPRGPWRIGLGAALVAVVGGLVVVVPRRLGRGRRA